LIRIGITGAAGFLGWHLRTFLLPDAGVEVVTAGRETFQSARRLQEFAGTVDAIVHLAGANRGDDAAVRETNVALAKQLTAACTAAGRAPHIVFANTTHHTRDSAYGTSKRMAAEVLAAWSMQSRAVFTNLIIPHVFGEGCRPRYNSAIATFCHQLAHGEQPRIIEDGELELIHAQCVAEHIKSVIDTEAGGEVRLQGNPIRVSEVLAKLQGMADSYAAQIIPALESPFDLDLFNSYRWYLFPQHFPVDLAPKRDARGSLFEAVKSLRGGQCFISMTQPGITRGNHYHRHKLERFLVLQGDALIRVRPLLGEKISEFRVSGRHPQYVDIPTLHTHNITNTGPTELTTLFWAHDIFDAAHPDTYPHAVKNE
jgi:UDP-2-acetamido-2,6-beta-L-arabino-hexul-4-ose reductase